VSTNVGVDVRVPELLEYDAVVLAGGATEPRDLAIPGRELGGIHQAMEYLPIANRVQEGDLRSPTITAGEKRVVIIGGGDTGADCLGTAHRQGAQSIHQFEILPRPPDQRAPNNPWPTWSNVFRVSSAHEEGGERVYSVNTDRFLGDEHGNVRALVAHQVEMTNGRFEKIAGTDFELPCELVLLAMGFLGPEHGGLLNELGVEYDARGNVARDTSFMSSVPGVFACGDMGRGQSLIVWAIAEGRACAANVDRYLAGDTLLPAPIEPAARPLV
jgi:glutamate synthase (NADPH/NADH) small chain